MQTLKRVNKILLFYKNTGQL